MAERQITDMPTKAVPNDRVTKDSETMILLAVNASFNGAAAATPFVPTLEILSDSGAVVGRFPTVATVAAGGSAEATFAPFLGRGAIGIVSGGGTPGLLDFTEVTGDVTITATSQATAQVVMTGTALTFDGIATVRIDLSALVQVDMRGNPVGGSGGFVIIELWDNGVFYTGLVDTGVSGIILTFSANRQIYYTPTAGSHTFSIRAWRGHGAGVGNPGVVVLRDITAGEATSATNFAVVQLNPPPT